MLESLEEAINNGDRGGINTLTSRFYTLIPHAFGRRVPPLITDAESVQRKRDMLNVLGDIEIARNLTEENADADSPKEVDHPLDANYKVLDADLEPLDQESEEYEAIDKYLTATMGDFRKLQLLDVFRLNRKTEGKRFSAHDDISNR